MRAASWGMFTNFFFFEGMSVDTNRTLCACIFPMAECEVFAARRWPVIRVMQVVSDAHYAAGLSQ